MIARKINYHGNFTQADLGCVFDITRKIEITGHVKSLLPNQIELVLEGDPSMIKLIQHSIERKVKPAIRKKTVEPIPYQNCVGITLLA